MGHGIAKVDQMQYKWNVCDRITNEEIVKKCVVDVSMMFEFNKETHWWLGHLHPIEEDTNISNAVRNNA